MGPSGRPHTSPAEAGEALSRKKVKRIVTKMVNGLTPGIVAYLSYTKAQADDRFLGNDITVIRRESATDSANIKIVNVPCPARMVVIGGGSRAEGASLIEPPAKVALKTDGPIPVPGDGTDGLARQRGRGSNGTRRLAPGRVRDLRDALSLRSSADRDSGIMAER